MFMTIDKIVGKARQDSGEQKKEARGMRAPSLLSLWQLLPNHKGKSCHPALQLKHNNLTNYIKTS